MLGALVLGALALATVACGDGPAPRDGSKQGRILGQALTEQVIATKKLVAPYRCARPGQELKAPTIPGYTSKIVGPVLEIASTGASADRLKLAYVADARGVEAETRAGIASLSKSITDEGTQIVISLGGQAQSATDLETLFADLLGAGDVLLIALPGDRESLPAHRQAVQTLAEGGARIIDGSHYRLIRVAGVVLANMPGIAMSSNLIAGVEGCQHLDIDASNLLSEGLSDDDVLVVNSYAPIRVEGVRAQDRGLGSIHVGERALQPLFEGHQVAVAVHGMVAPGQVAMSGKARITKEALLLAAGSLDPLERKSEALIVTMSGTKLDWHRLQVD